MITFTQHELYYLKVYRTSRWILYFCSPYGASPLEAGSCVRKPASCSSRVGQVPSLVSFLIRPLSFLSRALMLDFQPLFVIGTVDDLLGFLCLAVNFFSCLMTQDYQLSKFPNPPVFIFFLTGSSPISSSAFCFPFVGIAAALRYLPTPPDPSD